MLRSFNNNYELLRYIKDTFNTIANWLEISKREIKSIYNTVTVTAFLGRWRGHIREGRGLLKFSTSRRGLIREGAYLRGRLIRAFTV